MTDPTHHPHARHEAEARQIVEASNSHLRSYVRRRMMERWLS